MSPARFWAALKTREGKNNNNENPWSGEPGLVSPCTDLDSHDGTGIRIPANNHSKGKIQYARVREGQ